MYRGRKLVEVDTADVRVGDKIACLLSDAEWFPEVNGWHDVLLPLSRYEGLSDVTHRYFSFDAWAPCWVDESFQRHDLASKTLIVERTEQ